MKNIHLQKREDEYGAYFDFDTKLIQLATKKELYGNTDIGKKISELLETNQIPEIHLGTHKSIDLPEDIKKRFFVYLSLYQPHVVNIKDLNYNYRVSNINDCSTLAHFLHDKERTTLLYQNRDIKEFSKTNIQSGENILIGNIIRPQDYNSNILVCSFPNNKKTTQTIIHASNLRDKKSLLSLQAPGETIKINNLSHKDPSVVRTTYKASNTKNSYIHLGPHHFATNAGENIYISKEGEGGKTTASSLERLQSKYSGEIFTLKPKDKK